MDVKKAEQLIQHLKTWLDPILADPFVIPDLALAGEDETGQFHELLRRDLKGYSQDQVATTWCFLREAKLCA